jgi:hypothetical protein
MSTTPYSAPMVFSKGSLVTRTLSGVAGSTNEKSLQTAHVDTIPAEETAGTDA